MMIVHEKETNVKEICYSNLEDMPFPMVKFKAITDCFCSEDSIVVSVEKDKTLEAFKTFQYDVCKAGEPSLSYSIYEFTNSRKKEFIVRIVEWDRNKAMKTICEKSENAGLELHSEIYYMNDDLSLKIKSLLKKIRNYFRSEPKFAKADTVNLNSKVYVDYYGFSKTFQWGAPFAAQKTELFLDKTMAETRLLASKASGRIIPKVEVLFDLHLYVHEKISVER